MPDANIPENILGIPLFVPSANNYFSVDAGGLPNGDDCLVVSGDVSQNYKAYLDAPTLSPNAFLSRDAGFAISFWINAPAISHAAGVRNDQTIMAVMSSTKTTADGSQKTTAFRSNTSQHEPGMVWGIMSSGGGTSITFFRVLAHFYSTTSSVTEYYRASHVEATLNAGWNFVVINVGARNGVIYQPTGLEDSEIYVNGVQGTTFSKGASGLSHEFTAMTTSADQKFCIGSYSDQTNMSGRAGEYRLGKLNFHETKLSVTERQLLYGMMYK